MQETRHRRGPARLHPSPLGLTHPGLPFQLSVQIGALELLDYLGNNERKIRLLLQHFPCPSPPSHGDRLARRERTTGSHSGPVTLLRDLQTPGLLQRALPGNCRAVSPFLSGPPGGSRSRRLRSAGGKTSRLGVVFHAFVPACCTSSRAAAPLMRKGNSESCIFVFYYNGSFPFHLSVSAETGPCAQLRGKITPKDYQVLG